MIRVQAPSRLHFGLLSLAGEGRRFGGVGLMVQAPGVAVTCRESGAWSTRGPLAERAQGYVRRCAEQFPQMPPHEVCVESSGPEHAGLGTGTQLALAVGTALTRAAGLQLDAAALGPILGRGQRSALGIHGFDRGGFLVEGGKSTGPVAPLVARHDFPDDWRLVLTIPAWAEGIHGPAERNAFQKLLEQGASQPTTDALCRLALLGLLPALVERDLPAFGAALFEFNALVGAAFAPVQGGVYAHPRLAEVVAFIRDQGIPGVGQSSWGATIFAVVEDQERGTDLAGAIRERFGLSEGEVVVTSACNVGATIR